MAVNISNLTDNPNVEVVDAKGPFTVLAFKSDLSTTVETAMQEYYAGRMNVRRRQLLCDLSVCPVTIQNGEMQYMAGQVRMASGVRGVGDLVGRAVRGKVSNEAVINPEYSGDGLVVTEATMKHLVLVDTSTWNNSIVIEKGAYYAATANLKQKMIMRSNLSSAVAGNEGLFNLCFEGKGVLCLEMKVPYEELVCVELQNDELKIDGSYAVAWSGSLNFTVERSSRSLITSAVSGEGLVNVYRGTGKVLMNAF